MALPAYVVARPYTVVLTRHSQSDLESFQEFHRTRIWLALKALESKATAESARYVGDDRRGSALFELKIGRLRLRFTRAERVVTVEAIVLLESTSPDI